MDEITLDRNSLFPRFLSTYLDELPEDICKLRLMVILVTVGLVLGGFVAGVILTGVFFTVHAIFTFGTFSALLQGAYTGAATLLSILGIVGVSFVGLFAWIQTEIDDYQLRKHRKILNGELDPTDTRLHRTWDTIKEMYWSFKDKYCLKINYE